MTEARHHHPQALPWSRRFLTAIFIVTLMFWLSYGSMQAVVGFACQQNWPVSTSFGFRQRGAPATAAPKFLQHGRRPANAPSLTLLQMARKSKGPGKEDGTSKKQRDNQVPLEEIKFDFDIETLDSIDNDPVMLEAFIQRLQEAINISKTRDIEKYVEYIELKGRAKYRQERLLKERAMQDAESIPSRVATVDFEVIRQNLLHSFDFNLFKARVLDLFDWYRRPTVMKEYVAPYFALVQSSGMGKTKLLWELQKLVAEGTDKNFAGCVCKAILCSTGPFKEKIGDDYRNA
jgi:hypothetical protein